MSTEPTARCTNSFTCPAYDHAPDCPAGIAYAGCTDGFACPDYVTDHVPGCLGTPAPAAAPSGDRLVAALKAHQPVVSNDYPFGKRWSCPYPCPWTGWDGEGWAEHVAAEVRAALGHPEVSVPA